MDDSLVPATSKLEGYILLICDERSIDQNKDPVQKICMGSFSARIAFSGKKWYGEKKKGESS